jgi:hypothetical protein
MNRNNRLLYTHEYRVEEGFATFRPTNDLLGRVRTLVLLCIDSWLVGSTGCVRKRAQGSTFKDNLIKHSPQNSLIDLFPETSTETNQDEKHPTVNLLQNTNTCIRNWAIQSVETGKENYRA